MKIIDTILDVAQAVSAMVVPGASEVIAAGKSVIALIDEAKETFSESDTARLDAVRADLEAKVNAHADETIARLRG